MAQNQGAMGSSVPMVVTTAVEANAAVASGKLVTANSQYLANCATGCDPNFGVDCLLKFAMQEGGLCTGDGKSCQCSDRIKVRSPLPCRMRACVVGWLGAVDLNGR